MTAPSLLFIELTGILYNQQYITSDGADPSLFAIYKGRHVLEAVLRLAE